MANGVAFASRPFRRASWVVTEKERRVSLERVDHGHTGLPEVRDVSRGDGEAVLERTKI
jgi:hypothetical protein